MIENSTSGKSLAVPPPLGFTQNYTIHAYPYFEFHIKNYNFFKKRSVLLKGKVILAESTLK